MSVRLRPAIPEDAPALATLATDAFVAAFGHLYRPEDLAAFLAEHKTAAAYGRSLSDPAKPIQLAEVDDATGYRRGNKTRPTHKRRWGLCA